MLSLVLVSALALLGGSLVGLPTAQAAPGPIRQPGATSVTADALPTAQINGIVLAQAIAGNTVYAGGQFSTARPAGAAAGKSTKRRYNLMAYDIRTGKMTSFAPKVNGRIKAVEVSRDGKTLFIAGNFTKVGSSTRNRVASFTISTGKLTKFNPKVNAQVEAVANIGGVVYLGGWFTTVEGRSRSRLAAVKRSDGSLLKWAPKANGMVHALAVTPDKKRVIAGGGFTKLGSKTATGMGSLDATSAAVKPWKINTVVKNSGSKSAIYALSADRDTIYGTGYTTGSGNFEGVFAADPATGNIKWLQDCHGDTYDVAAAGAMVYSVGHAHYCANIGGFPESKPYAAYRALAASKAATGTVNKNGQVRVGYGNFAGQKAPSLYNWFPELTIGSVSGSSQAAWTVAANSQYVVLGGEFTRVNGKVQQGLVRMTVPAKAPNKQGPRVSGAEIRPTVTVRPTSTALSWKTNWDRDDQVLTYEVLRSNAVIGTVKAKSHFWSRPRLSYVDASGASGRTYTYQIRVRDPRGNVVTSPTVKVVYP